MLINVNTIKTIVPSFIDLTSLDLKLSGDGAVTISCGRRFHVPMVRGRNECRY